MAKEVHTEDSQEYTFEAAPANTLKFKVKAGHDAHIALSSSDDQEATPVYEVFIGGWNNAKSAIRRDRTKPDRAEAETPDILSDDELRGFWMNWDNEGKVEVGRDGESEPFLSYTDPEPFTVTHYGLRTAWGASGEWEIEGGEKLSTSNDSKYTFRPTCQGRLLFSVRAAHNAHVALTNAPKETDHIYEVFIGGWNNSRTAIRKNRSKPDVAITDTPNILSLDGFRGFEICWHKGHITLKDSASGVTIVEWQDPEPIPITHYGIRTAWGAQGDWQINKKSQGDWQINKESQGDLKINKNLADADQEAEIIPKESSDVQGEPDEPETPGEAVWVAASGGDLPDGAVCGGNDHDCELFVARAVHEGALLPGKMVPSHGACYVAWDGGEHRKEEYEILCGVKPTWVQVNQGDEIPSNALPGGRTIDGETLFIGRVPHEGTVTVGKVHPSHATCYIPYGGEEVGFPEYEILVRE